MYFPTSAFCRGRYVFNSPRLLLRTNEKEPVQLQVTNVTLRVTICDSRFARFAYFIQEQFILNKKKNCA